MRATRRVVVAKVGLDGHDVGARLVAQRLRDAGFETIYLGKRNRSAEIAATAVQEDADVIGISCLSGGLGHFAVMLTEALEHSGVRIPVLTGGIAEPEEVQRMLRAGIQRHFGPGTPLDEVVAAFADAAATMCDR